MQRYGIFLFLQNFSGVFSVFLLKLSVLRPAGLIYTAFFIVFRVSFLLDASVCNPCLFPVNTDDCFAGMLICVMCVTVCSECVPGSGSRLETISDVIASNLQDCANNLDNNGLHCRCCRRSVSKFAVLQKAAFQPLKGCL